MKKGIQLCRVEINATGRVTCYGKTKNGSEEIIPLTRTQRQLMKDYMDNDFRERVIEEFSNPDIFSDKFQVIREGNK
jgi:hypothetical protein